MIQKINRVITKADLKKKIWGFDIETYNIKDPKQAINPFNVGTRVCTIALCNGITTYGFTLEHPDFRNNLDRDYGKHIKEIWKVLNDPTITLVGHCVVEFDTVFCELYFNRQIKCKFFDTLVAYSLLNENADHNTLDNVAREILNAHKIVIESKYLNEYSIKDVIEYNMHDALLSYQLYKPLNKKLDKEDQTFILDVSLNVLKILKNMMVLGTAQDIKWLDKGLHDSELEFIKLETSLRQFLTDFLIQYFKRKSPDGIDACHVLAKKFNFNSPQQLSDLLFLKMELPVIERTPTGNPGTGKDILIQLQHTRLIDEHGIMRSISPDGKQFVKTLNEYRKVKKLISTYLIPLLTKHSISKRVHTRFHMGRKQFGKYDVSGTRTGRLSSSNPNLQNQPRTEVIRGSFIPTKKYKMFAADYKQLELRIAAWYSQDKEMLKAFKEGLDIHTLTLSKIKGIPYEECMDRLAAGDAGLKENRVVAKNTNFLILYGGGAWRLTKTARVAGVFMSNAQAKQIIDRWKFGFPELANTLELWEKVIRRYGFSSTPVGRKRRLPNAKLSGREGSTAIRQGINSRIQSFASDITLIAMMILDKKFNGSYILDSRKKKNARLLLQVHDEIVGEYKGYTHTEIKNIVTKCMTEDVNRYLKLQRGVNIPIPLEIDIDTNMKRWT